MPLTPRQAQVYELLAAGEAAVAAAEPCPIGCVPRTVYLYVLENGGYCKIGISRIPNKRLRQLQTRLPTIHPRWLSRPGDRRKTMELEKAYHRVFEPWRARHTPFPRPPVGASEWFLLCDDMEIVFSETLRPWQAA